MSQNEKHHIVKYRTYIFVLLGLLTLTGISVAVTGLNLGPFAVTVALVLAGIKSTLVLLFFMHLKFDQPVYGIMVLFVLAVFVVVMIITFLDYSFR
ncbi:MAG: cytochrome C oxidase subunit IV family protein [Bacteroidales bacterium]|nr:cytochrome C oxidase subunit IV family protein [Bacteroidales bacterium]